MSTCTNGQSRCIQTAPNLIEWPGRNIMSPRPYRLGEREATIQQTRERIIAAARTVLTTSDDFAGFSLEAVARQANVARMTVYYQFGSKVGLLEAICDTLAQNGG